MQHGITPYRGKSMTSMIERAFALTARKHTEHTIPRALPWAMSSMALQAVFMKPFLGHPLHRWLFFVFSSRRGDFEEMMDVRCGDRGARSPELTSSQTSGTQCPPLRLVFFLFFSKFVSFDRFVFEKKFFPRYRSESGKAERTKN